MEWGEIFFSSEEFEWDYFLWYMFVVDGMVELEFLLDVDVRDLIFLLEVINCVDLGKLLFDDDIIMLLWECDFWMIEYFVIEGYIDMGEFGYFGGLSEFEVKVMVMMVVIELGGEVGKKFVMMFEVVL